MFDFAAAGDDESEALRAKLNELRAREEMLRKDAQAAVDAQAVDSSSCAAVEPEQKKHRLEKYPTPKGTSGALTPRTPGTLTPHSELPAGKQRARDQL
eukprot:1442591-Karenia_brevis.AAC.1